MIEQILEQLPSTTPYFILVTGFAIGLLHAFEPDHMAAVSTQVLGSKQKKSKLSINRIGKNTIKTSILGAFWGLGHTSSLIIVSVSIFIFSLRIPNEIFKGLELGIGLMLVLLGVWLYINKKTNGPKHVHPHVHTDGTIHTHPHDHHKDHLHGHKSYLIGCLHGIAGSGSLVILAASTLNDIQAILSFTIVFGIGSILGMMLISGAIGLPLSLISNASKIYKILRYLIGGISVVIGFTIIFEILIKENVFGF